MPNVREFRLGLDGRVDFEFDNDTNLTSNLSSLVVSGVNLFPPTVDVTRNSANDSTDANEVTMATFTIPAGTLKVGSIIEVWSLFENTNSASTKTFTVRVNGSSVGNSSNTTNQSFGFRLPFHVHDLTSLVLINNAASPGSGSASGAIFAPTITNLNSNNLVITITSKWGAAASGEFIRLKHSKLNLVI